MIHIPFNHIIPFIIIEKDKLHIVWQKIFHINKWFQILENEEILEYFLNHPDFFKHISVKPKQKHIYEKFLWYFFIKDEIYYHNILFLLLDKNNWKNFQNISCLHNNKIYKFETQNLEKNFGFLFPNLNQPLYELVKNLEDKKVQIYYNQKVKEK